RPPTYRPGLGTILRRELLFPCSPNPCCKLRFCFAQDRQHGLTILGWHVGVGFANIMPCQNLFQTTPQITFHFARQTIEAGTVDQEAAWIAKKACVEIELIQGSPV